MNKHTKIKDFLGKYSNELLESTKTKKYTNAGLDKFFEQRFYIQDNKTQMIVDPLLEGLSVVTFGNEIFVSKSLYDHPNVVITNSMELGGGENLSKTLYTPDIFSSIAYLLCQNTTMFHINGDLGEPLYIKHKSDFECFYNSVILVKIDDELKVEVVEEIDSKGALNSVTNYIIGKESTANIFTFYQNILSAHSFLYRNIIANDNSSVKHTQFGKGSSNVLDETRLHLYNNVNAKLHGCIAPGETNYNMVLGLQTSGKDSDIEIRHRLVLTGDGIATFVPVTQEGLPANIDVTSYDTGDVPLETPKSIAESYVNSFISDVVDNSMPSLITGTERFYKNKSDFLGNL